MRRAIVMCVLATSAAGAEPPADRVLVLSSASEAYRSLAVRPSIRTNPDAPVRLVVYKDGLAVADRGLVDAQTERQSAVDGRLVVERRGTTERAAVAPDLSSAVVVTTTFTSRVDITPGTTSTADDLVVAVTDVALVDPAHPQGRWRVTLEDSRWVRDLVALAHGSGAALTSFVPRNGPTDFRAFDATGRLAAHVPVAQGETVSIAAGPGGGFVAADVKLPDTPGRPERGLMVFDLAKGTSWTYGWRYGSDAEPVSWTLDEGGVLAVRRADGTRRFDRTGRRR